MHDADALDSNLAVDRPMSEAVQPVEEDVPLLIRAPAVGDLSYVQNIWSRELEKTPMGRLGGEHMRDVCHRWMRGILARTRTVSLVACHPEARATILGFAVYQNRSQDTAGLDSEGVMHCVYVRPEMRGCGIAKRLTKHYVGKACSLRTWKGCRYIPERLWR